MDPWQTVLLAFGGNAVLLVVLGKLAQSLLSQWLTKDIEKFKASLQSETAASAERLRHQFQLAALEHQVAFSKLHERRAQVVEEAYRLLVELQREAALLPYKSQTQGSMQASQSSMQESLRTSEAKAKQFYEFFDRNRIFLPSRSCEKLEEFWQGLLTALGNYSLVVFIQKLGQVEATPYDKAHASAWAKACQYIEKELPSARAVLEKEFRDLLAAAPGVS